MRWGTGNEDLMGNHWDSYDLGYAHGWEEGRYQGYADAAIELEEDFSKRAAKMWVEVQTLNARINYLTKVLDKQDRENGH